jgi:hypothetical protein
VAAYDDAHDLQVQYEKTDDLPEEGFPPETGGPGGDRWIGFILVSPGDVFSEHIIFFSDCFIFSAGC